MEDEDINNENEAEKQESDAMEPEPNEEQSDEEGAHDFAALSKLMLRNVDLTALNRSASIAQAIVAKFNQAFDGARIIADAMAPYQETISRIATAYSQFQMSQLAYPSELVDQLSKTARLFGDKMASVVTASIRYQDYAETIFESLQPSLDAIRRTIAQYDTGGFWEKSSAAAERWGDLGWVILDDMPLSMMMSCPDTYPEANRLCRHMALEQLERLRHDLPNGVRKKADAIEMFELYDARHYKACAMMACSLIEGEFMNWKIAKTGNRKGNGSPKGLIAVGGERSAQAAAVRLLNVVAAHRHFFQSGNGFDRSREGELNRNFLMHGMMHKKVTQIACVKLILLLDKVTKILPLCDVPAIGD